MNRRQVWNHFQFHPHQNVQWRLNEPRARGRFQREFQPHMNSFPTYQNYNSDEHWCETCDRGFRTLDLLNNHKAQHQKCNIDGCQFIAHPKVITKHIQMQHSSGLYKKIAKLNDPEEIRKWREERKKKFPTRSNIEKKAAELKEKIERGEKMGLKQDRLQGKHNYRTGADRKRKFSNGNHHNQNPKRQFQRTDQMKQNPKAEIDQKKERACQLKKKQQIEKPLQVDNRKLKPFAGIQDIINDDNDCDKAEEELSTDNIIDDDEFLESPKESLKNNSIEPTVCGALSFLISNYDSSDEEQEINKNETSHNISINNHTKNSLLFSDKLEVLEDNSSKLENHKSPINIVPNNDPNQSDNDSGPEEVKTSREYDIVQNDFKENHIMPITKVKQEKNNLRCIHRKPKPRVPSTLLRKLLSKEIRQERNIVLQCVRYIVKNNYFDK